jgi:hypothetical protein
MFRRLDLSTPLWRSRYAAFGAAVAVTLSGGAIAVTMAAGSDPAPSSFVPITPCRIMDTRADSVVGVRNTPLLGDQPYTIQVQGTNGNCTIPVEATAVNMNVTSVNPTSTGFLTIWPSTSERPLASSLNWLAGQGATPNSVNAAIGSTGQISFSINAGSVDLVADVTGYFVPGAAGPKGDKGDPGVTPLSGFQDVLVLSSAAMPGAEANGVAVCPAGKTVVGGGAPGLNTDLLESYPSVGVAGGQLDRWNIRFKNNGMVGAVKVAVHAICVNYVP